MIDMEMHHIRYFLAVYKVKNFTTASKQCCVAQPSLSKAIKQLEQELGGALFIRGRSPIEPTELGRLIYPQMCQILEGTAQVNQLSKHFSQLQSIPLSLGIESTVGSKKILPMLSLLKSSYPHLEVELYFDTSDNLVHRLDSLELDAIISPSVSLNLDTFSLYPLYNENYHVVFHKDHPLKEKETISLKQIESLSYLDRVHCDRRNDVLKHCTEKQICLYPTYRSESDKWIQELVAEQIGISIFPEYSITHPFLISKRLINPSITRKIVLILLLSQKETPKCLALQHMLIQFPWRG